MNQRGSALLLAVFLLALLTGMALGLHFISQNELFMSSAHQRSKQAYFLAEAGIEAGRQALYDTNGDGPFDDDLDSAAGANASLDFDPETVRPVYAENGTVSGFTGYDDDQPLLDVTALGDGWYAAFLTNDPGNTGGESSATDDNERVMISAVGAGRDGSLEVVQAIVEPAPPFPGDLPALITIFGPSPTFSDFVDPIAAAKGKVIKLFQGDDCGGSGIPGFSVPVLGLIGTPAETVVEYSLSPSTSYTSGGMTGHWTVVDTTDPTDPGIVASSLGPIDPQWINCQALRGMAEEVRDVADVICTEGVPCTLPPSGPGRVVFAEGDFNLDFKMSGAGMLWVTGRLTMSAKTDWNGVIMVVGEGQFVRSGIGKGAISGAIAVADIAGPDNTYGTEDDCSGTSDGFQPAVYDESGCGKGTTTVYCHADVLAATPLTRYPVMEFRQR